MTTATDREIAHTIIGQIGNEAFNLLGAYGFSRLERGLQFKVKGSRKVNAFQITLTPDDTYTVKSMMVSFSRTTYEYSERNVMTESGLFANQLLDVIESRSGLYASLRPRH